MMNGIHLNGRTQGFAGKDPMRLVPGKRKVMENLEVHFHTGLHGTFADVETRVLGNGDTVCTIDIQARYNRLSASIKMRNAAAWVRVIQGSSSSADMEVIMGDNQPPDYSEITTLALLKLKIIDPDDDADSNCDDDDDFQIFVKLFSGKSSVFSVNSEKLVRDLKVEIQRKTQLPVDQQRLIYQGKQLEDGRSIGYYGIKPDQTLNLVTRLRGG